jgi:hypothetical protein
MKVATFLPVSSSVVWTNRSRSTSLEEAHHEVTGQIGAASVGPLP